MQGTFLEGKPIMAVSAYTGQGIPELKEALRLLVSTQLSVADVAKRLGYANPSYFIRCFEQRYHRTPGAVRRTASENEKE